MGNKTEKQIIEMTAEERRRYDEYVAWAEKRSGRVSVRIPGPLYRVLNARSDETGKTKSELVVDALRRDLAASGLID